MADFCFFFVLYFSVSEGSLLVIVIMQFLNLAVKIQCSRVIRDFKIGHDGRLGRLDAYTGGLEPSR